jgi:tRNA A-37 threonylcarbamoyl transferase component Bud32
MSTEPECPDLNALQRLLLGKTAPVETETLEVHVLACPRCAQTMQGIDAEDMLVAAMREARTEPGGLASPAAEALMPWLKRLRPKDAKDATQTLPPLAADATAPPPPPMATVLPTYDFLAAPQQPDELGRLARYRVLQSIGVGGMGMVFLAEDTKLQRQVALKIIKPELLERQDLHERFLTEARAIAAVEHDNIVVIYEAGDAGSVPYLVMPLLRGESLEDRLKRQDGPLPVDEILRISREIAAGLDAAHQRGLVHRDIKPSNLWLESLVRGPSSVAKDSRIKILDFGLARTIEGLSEDGEARAILGTPAYMSPEQGRGMVSDGRSDLFSLGCVMYRMATGRTPFRGKDVITTLLSVATETPVAPKNLNPKLPADLAALIEKLLAKKVEERCASAQEVVDAIRKMERQLQPRRIGRWLAALAACVTLAVAGTFAMVSYLHRPPPPVEVRFDYDEPDALLVIEREDGSEQEFDAGQEPVQKLPPGNYAIRAKNSNAERHLSPSTFTVAPNEPVQVPLRLVGLIRSYHGHSQTIVSAVAFLRIKDAAISACYDWDLRVWDLGKEDTSVRIEGHESPVRCLAVSPDGKHAVTGSGKPHPREPDIYVRFWDLNKREISNERPGHKSTVTAVAYDPKGKTVMSGDMDGVVIFWDAETQKRIEAIDAHDRSTVHGIAYLPDGRQALTAGGDHKVHLWDVAKRRMVKTLEGHKDVITGVSASADGKHAATSSFDGTVRIWDLETGASRNLAGHEKKVLCVAYAPDGKRILSGGEDENATLRLWNAETGEEIDVSFGHRRQVRSVTFSADGRRALSGGADGVVRLWELPK